MPNMNTEEILREVENEIKEKEMETEFPLFSETTKEPLPFCEPTQFDAAKLKKETYRAMMVWDTSVDSLDKAAGLKGKVKKLLNKMAIHSMNSHMVSQNAFNASVVEALLQVNQLAEENKALKEEIELLKSEIEKLK